MDSITIAHCFTLLIFNLSHYYWNHFDSHTRISYCVHTPVFPISRPMDWMQIKVFIHENIPVEFDIRYSLYVYIVIIIITIIETDVGNSRTFNIRNVNIFLGEAVQYYVISYACENLTTKPCLME